MCCGLVGYEECVVFVKLFVKNDEEKLGVQFSGRYICIVIKKQISTNQPKFNYYESRNIPNQFDVVAR